MAQLIAIGWLLTIILAIASSSVILRDHDYGIVGGVPAKITEVPHQVYLRKKPHSLFCGGSIISRYHILTAGHCVEEVDADDIVVVVGTDQLSSADDANVFEVAKITVHENYTIENSPFRLLNDVAVLKLKKRIRLSKKARIIPLAKPKHLVKDGTELIVSGWGRTSEHDWSTSDKLRKLSQPKISFDKCYQMYAKENDVVTEDMICAGGEAGKCAFKGDSGGPLIQKTRAGYLQVGVVSYHEPDLPNVYTQVSKYFKWIKNIVQGDLEPESDSEFPLGKEFDF